jgi:hypothetical protein
MDPRGLDPTEFLRQDHPDADLHEVLRGPVDALAGVSAEAVAALAQVGVESVFDLATSTLFALAQEAADATETSSLASRFGVTPHDWLEPGTTFGTLADIAELPVATLRGLGAAGAATLTAALDVETIRDFASWPPRLVAKGLLARAVGAPPADDEDASADILRPRLGDYPTERVYYDRLVMLHMDDGDSVRKALDAPVSLSPAAKPGFAFDRIAVGAMLTYAQSWFAEGLTLGQLLHSLALAPGEATRIAVIDWSRRTSAFTSEAITEQEQLDNTSTHARALSEVQNAVANEMQQGASATSGWTDARSTASASSGSSGLVESLLGGSSSGSTTEEEATTAFGARSSSWSQGNRSVTASLEQQVNDRTEQHATSVRNRRASAVREVSQAEHEDVSTRIVANYNHMHALTVQYFEVVQLYRTRTQLHRGERCLFVPMEYPDFTAPDAIDLVQRFRGALLGAALTARARDLLADDSTSVTVYPVRPPGIVIVDPLPLPPATNAAAMTAAAPGAARLRPIAAVRAAVGPRPATAAAAATAVDGEDGAPAGGAGGQADTEVSSAWAWEPALISRAVHLVGRPILRPGSADARLPEEALLVGVDFDGIDAAAVQLERPGITAADSTYAVPEGLSSLDLVPGIPLDAITGIRVSKKGDDPASGSLTLRCTLYGRQFETPRLTLSLGRGTGLGRVARLENDRADRQVELLEHLHENVAHYGQAMFRSLDAATIVGLLAPFTWNGKPLVELVEPTPVTVAGNFLVLRAPVDADEDSGVDGKTWSALLDDLGVGSRSDERLVPIATGGVFAEAVLGRSNSAEKLDITRFWNWQDSPAPLTPPEIAPVATGTRATPEDLQPGQLGPPVVNITNPTALPDPAGLSAVLNAVTAANMFRDMSGLQGTQSLAQSAVSGTLGAATAAGQMANETLRAEIQRQMAEMQLAADVAKAAIGVPPEPKDDAGISGQGAKINHGKSMDDRGVGGGAGGGPPGETAPTDGGSAGGNTMDTGAGDGSGGSDVMTASGDQMPMSREAAYSDQSALGYSPSGVSSLLGVLPVQPAVFHAQNGGGSGGGGTSSLPPTVKEFEDVLKQTLFPNDPLIQKVGIAELTAQIHFPALASMGYGAWTNSATQIFVTDLAGAVDPFTNKPLSAGAIHTIIAANARHESNHIRDFAANGGPPKSYAQMMDFEARAYTDAAGWLAGTQGKSVAADAKWRDIERRSSVVYADAFKAEIARVNKLNVPAADKEAQFKAFLVGTSKTNTIRKALRAARLTTEQGDAEPMLPPHGKIADLY